MDLAHATMVNRTLDKQGLALVCVALIVTLATAFAVVPTTAKMKTFAEDKAASLRALQERNGFLATAQECAAKANTEEALLDCLDAEYQARTSSDERLQPAKSRVEARAELAVGFF